MCGVWRLHFTTKKNEKMLTSVKNRGNDISRTTFHHIYHVFIIFVWVFHFLEIFYLRLVHPTTVWYDQWLPAKAFEVCPQNEYFFKSKCSLNCIKLYLIYYIRYQKMIKKCTIFSNFMKVFMFEEYRLRLLKFFVLHWIF